MAETNTEAVLDSRDGDVPVVQRKALTVDDIWQDTAIMSLNADLGVSMEDIVKFVRLVEKAHDIK